MPSVNFLCDSISLTYTINSQNEVNIKNAIGCAKTALNDDAADTLIKALKFIYLYITQGNRFSGDIAEFNKLIDLIYGVINIQGPLTITSTKILSDLSYILNILYREPYRLHKNDLIINLSETFKIRLSQTTNFLSISGAADFINRFIAMFTLYGRDILVNSAAIQDTFNQFKDIQADFMPVNHTDYNYVNKQILSLFALLSHLLNEKLTPNDPNSSNANLDRTIRTVAFELAKRDKKIYYLDFLLSKSPSNTEKALAECQQDVSFCEAVHPKTILPNSKTLDIEDFKSTIHYENANENVLKQLLLESYLETKKIYDPVFGENAFQNKNFNPEIFIFPNRSTYQKFGYELFQFQTNNGGQTFYSELSGPHSCRIAIYLDGEIDEIISYYNLAHELAHCYEGAASLQSKFANVDILPDSIRESIPQVIQNEVLDSRTPEKFRRLSGVPLEKSVYSLSKLGNQSNVLGEIINQPDGAVQNYYKATLLAAFLIKKEGALKEVMSCTHGKHLKAARNQCLSDFTQKHKAEFLLFLNEEFENSSISIETTNTLRQRRHTLATPSISAKVTSPPIDNRSLLWAIYFKNITEVDSLLTRGVGVNDRNQSTGNTPLHALFSWGYCDEISLVKRFLRAGANISVTNNEMNSVYKTASNYCSKSNNWEEMNSLLLNKQFTDPTFEKLLTSGNLDALKQAVADGFSPEGFTKAGKPYILLPIEKQCGRENYEIILYLLQPKYEQNLGCLDDCVFDGYTPREIILGQCNHLFYRLQQGSNGVPALPESITYSGSINGDFNKVNLESKNEWTITQRLGPEIGIGIANGIAISLLSIFGQNLKKCHATHQHKIDFFFKYVLAPLTTASINLGRVPITGVATFFVNKENNLMFSMGYYFATSLAWSGVFTFIQGLQCLGKGDLKKALNYTLILSGIMMQLSSKDFYENTRDAMLGYALHLSISALMNFLVELIYTKWVASQHIGGNTNTYRTVTPSHINAEVDPNNLLQNSISNNRRIGFFQTESNKRTDTGVHESGCHSRADQPMLSSDETWRERSSQSRSPR